jgi:hypothetical protein
VRRIIVIGAGLVLAFVYLLYQGGIAFISSLAIQSDSAVAHRGAPDPVAFAPRSVVPSPAAPPSKLPPAIRSGAMPAPTRPALAVSAVGASGPSQRGAVARDLRRQVVAGLSEFKARLASCSGTRIGGEEIEGLKRPLVLILEVATRDGRMEVIDVAREKRGRAGAEFLGCARSVLRGRVIEAPAARAGSRMWIAFPLKAA